MILLSWEITSVRVTGLSRDKFTMGNIHGYVKKRKETAHDIKLGKKLGFSIPKQNNHQVSSNWNCKNCFFKLFSFAPVERKIDGDMADFMAKFWTGLLK